MTRRLRVAVVSHAYLEPELRKNIIALDSLVEARVVSPARATTLIFDDFDISSAGIARNLFIPFRAIRLFGTQYLLRTATMGFKQFEPDVIHVEYEPWLVVFWQTLLVRRLFAPSARIVCNVKKNTYRAYPGIRSRLKRRLALAGLRRVDLLIATSDMTAEMYEALFGVKSTEIAVITHLGVDVETFAPSPDANHDRQTTVGYVGQLSAHKGVEDLVAAVAICRAETGRDLRLRLLGSGPLADSLRCLSLTEGWLGVEGPVPNREVATFLREIDVFVLPARVLKDHQEHDAHALLEALAVGVPSIGTESGIIPEILGDGTGVIVEPSSPDALSHAIRELLDDHSLRASLGRKGRAKAVREFAVAEVADRKAAIYRRAARA